MASPAESAEGTQGGGTRQRMFAWGQGAVAAVGTGVAGAGAGVASGVRHAGGWAADSASNVKNADYAEMGMAFKGYTVDNVHAMRQAGLGAQDAIGKSMEKRKHAAERKLFELSVPLRAKVMGAIKDIVKSGVVSDPDMCDAVKERLGDLVDLFWEDLATTVDEAFENSKAQVGDKSVVKTYDGFANLGGRDHERPCTLSPRWWRAQFLYHLIPFDLSIFGNLRDPWFLVEMVFMCLPSFTFLPEPYNRIPVRVPYFVLYLILLWRTGVPEEPRPDEYQLVLFIMSIKGLQAISSGIIAMCIAACQYYTCVHPSGTHSCDTTGPGVTIPLEISFVDWFGISMLVWMAFLMLPYSNRTAGVRDPLTLGAELEEDNDNQSSNSNSKAPLVESNLQRQGSARSQRSGCCLCCGQRDADRGGRLAGWLRYDFMCFVLSLFVCFGLMNIDVFMDRDLQKIPDTVDGFIEQWRSPQGKSAIFWARVVYALLSLPFVLFWIPGLQGILTHTRLTGYNRYGRVVPYTMRPMPEAKEDPAQE